VEISLPQFVAEGAEVDHTNIARQLVPWYKPVYTLPKKDKSSLRKARCVSICLCSRRR
jgi:hypothetical protein